jgi:hypothetical protein
VADPTTIFSSVGLVAWFRGDSFTESSGTLLTVPDQSGNGRNLTLNGTPTYEATGLAGHPCAVMNGTSQYLTSTAIGTLLVGGNNNTTYASLLFQRIATVASGECFVNLGGASGSANPFTRFVCGNSATQWEARWREISSGAGQGGVGGTADDLPHIVELVRTATTLDLLIDGVSQIGGPQSVSVDLSSYTIDRFSIGALVRNTVGAYCNMRFGEGVFLDGVPNAVETAAFRRYLSERYGLIPTTAATLDGLVAAATVASGDAVDATVAASLAGLTGAATVTQTETSTVAATLAGLTASATVTQTETFTVGPPPPRQAWIGSSTLKGTLGVTTSWTEHYTSFLQGIEADASFLNLGENAYTTWHLLPTGSTGQPGFAPAVDTARNVTTALAHPGVQLVGYNANEILQARDTYGFAGDLDTPGTGYVDAYLIPNMLTIEAECIAAGVPFVVCTSQPRDTDSDADFIAGTVYANQRILETFGADRVIDFHAFLVDVDGTLVAAYTTDGVHPDDDATPGLSALVEAKALELLASSFPPVVVAASINPAGAPDVFTTVAAALDGLTAAATVGQAAQPATVAAVLASGLTGAATVTVAAPVTMTVDATLADLTVDANMVHDDGTGGGATGGTRRRSRRRFRGFAPQ